MNKQDKVAKLLDKCFGLKVIRGSYHKETEPYKNGVVWRMGVDPSQFSDDVVFEEDRKTVKVFGVLTLKGWSHARMSASVGIYDVGVIRRDTMSVGSACTIQEILDEVNSVGTERLYLEYDSDNGEFWLSIYPSKLEYKGNKYDEQARMMEQLDDMG